MRRAGRSHARRVAPWPTWREVGWIAWYTLAWEAAAVGAALGIAWALGWMR